MHHAFRNEVQSFGKGLVRIQIQQVAIGDIPNAPLVVPVKVIKDRKSILAAKFFIGAYAFGYRTVKNQQSQSALRQLAIWRENTDVGGNLLAGLERGLCHLHFYIELFAGRIEDLCPSRESLFRLTTRGHCGSRQKNISPETRIIRNGCGGMAVN